MRRLLILIVSIFSIGTFLVPAASAQEALLAPTNTPVVAEGMKAVNVTTLNPSLQKMIQQFLDHCQGCTIADFFPMPHKDGTLDDHIFAYWPRETAGTWSVPVDNVMLGYEESSSGLFPLTTGIHKDVKFGLLTTGYDTYDLLTQLPTYEQLGDVPYRPEMCDGCGNEEFFPWMFPVGERIAYGTATDSNEVTITNNLAVLAWYGSDLWLITGPGKIDNLPYAHLWWVYDPS